jgi:hypothetical protein
LKAAPPPLPAAPFAIPESHPPTPLPSPANTPEFVGCSPSLSGAIRVNPWSIESVADGMYSALKTSKQDRWVDGSGFCRDQGAGFRVEELGRPRGQQAGQVGATRCPRRRPQCSYDPAPGPARGSSRVNPPARADPAPVSSRLFFSPELFILLRHPFPFLQNERKAAAPRQALALRQPTHGGLLGAVVRHRPGESTQITPGACESTARLPDHPVQKPPAQRRSS